MESGGREEAPTPSAHSAAGRRVVHIASIMLNEA